MEEKQRKRKKRRPVDYTKGYRRELMQIMLTAGSVSYDGMHVLNKSHPMYAKKLRQMEKEGIVEISRIKRKKLARLKNFEKKSIEYIEFFPGYYKHYNKYAKDNATDAGREKSDITRCKKAYREAEIIEMMHGAEIRSFPMEKAELYKGQKIGSEAVYYSDIELKDVNGFKISKESKNGKSVINSRAIGGVFSAGGNYIIYHTGNESLKWSIKNEGQMALHISTILNKYGYWQQSGKIEENIIFANSDKPFLQMYKEKRGTYVKTENGYNHTYILPYDKNGQRLLQKMLEANWKEKMLEEYLVGGDEEVVVNDYNWSISCDAHKGNVNMLLFCIPDIVKLKKFLMSAEWTEEKENYQIYCYDFQQEFIEAVAGKYAEIYVTEL